MAKARQLVEHFFRHESANLVSVLTRAFGIRRIDLIEDVVQVAMLEAMHSWKQRGVPENPTAWIHRAAKNRLLDALRREKSFVQAVSIVGRTQSECEAVVDAWLDEEHLPDSLLRMMFVCCHPGLERKTQIALTLKTLCGFGVIEISRGLLMPEETVKKRISRAKKTLAEANVSIELPVGEDLSGRMAAVHDVLYLLFNEGYSTSKGVEPIRDDMCEEAARLCHLLCETPTATPATKALLALMLFHAARLDSRLDEDGAIILLEEQDRSRWNQPLIQIGQYWLASSKDITPTPFHLEAAIAKQHCIAASFADTNWLLIVKFYDRLLQMHASPVVALNRAIAIGESGETAVAMRLLEELRNEPGMAEYLLLDCAIARLYERQGNREQAVECYLSALQKATAEHERKLLRNRLAALA